MINKIYCIGCFRNIRIIKSGCLSAHHQGHALGLVEQNQSASSAENKKRKIDFIITLL